MSLIKAADVPQHLADRLRARGVNARLARGPVKPHVVPEKQAPMLPESPAVL